MGTRGLWPESARVIEKSKEKLLFYESALREHAVYLMLVLVKKGLEKLNYRNSFLKWSKNIIIQVKRDGNFSTLIKSLYLLQSLLLSMQKS